MGIDDFPGKTAKLGKIGLAHRCDAVRGDLIETIGNAAERWRDQKMRRQSHEHAQLLPLQVIERLRGLRKPCRQLLKRAVGKQEDRGLPCGARRCQARG